MILDCKKSQLNLDWVSDQTWCWRSSRWAWDRGSIPSRWWQRSNITREGRPQQKKAWASGWPSFQKRPWTSFSYGIVSEACKRKLETSRRHTAKWLIVPKVKASTISVHDLKIKYWNKAKRGSFWANISILWKWNDKLTRQKGLHKQLPSEVTNALEFSSLPLLLLQLEKVNGLKNKKKKISAFLSTVSAGAEGSKNSAIT